jgi:hypothetical protein
MIWSTEGLATLAKPKPKIFSDMPPGGLIRKRCPSGIVLRNTQVFFSDSVDKVAVHV